jgi:hypothetical protein
VRLSFVALLCGSETMLRFVCQSRRRCWTDNPVNSILRSLQRVSRGKTIDDSMCEEASVSRHPTCFQVALHGRFSQPACLPISAGF